MRFYCKAAFLTAGLAATTAVLASDRFPDNHHRGKLQWAKKNRPPSVQLGPRPYFLRDNLPEGGLKSRLLQCSSGSAHKSDFSIGHRGAAMQFPEHTRESYGAAARMGAGIIECDVTFTQDKQLVCRHSQCDLHTTTNILAIPELAAKCSLPFSPANPETGVQASAQCCTSDITVDEFKSLCGKMDASDPGATTVEEYMGGTSDDRTDLYSSCGTVITHAESIELIGGLGSKFTPELKAPSVPMPFEGTYSQKDYAQQMLDEYKQRNIPARQVWPQSFNLDDIKYWLANEPHFGRQAVYLDGRVDQAGGVELAIAEMDAIAAMGVRILAPPLWALVTLDGKKIVPSQYARSAKSSGLDLIAWTLERSGRLRNGGGYYYQSIQNTIDRDSDALLLLDVLAQDIGVLGVFSDWPATVTYYANCMGL